MDVRISNLSRAPMALRIPGQRPLQPGESVIVSEFLARRAQLQSEMRTGRLFLQDAETGKEVDFRYFRPNPLQGQENLLSRLTPLPIPKAYVQPQRKIFEGDFYAFEDHDGETETVDAKALAKAE